MKTCSRCNLEKKTVAFPKEKSTVCNRCRVISNIEKSKKFLDKEDIGICNLNSEAKEIKIISKYLVPTRFVSYDKALKKVEGVSYKVVDEDTIYISEFIKAEKEDILTKINVLERDNYTCSYCNKDANTVDHKITLSKGGESTEKNLVACCGECNVAKDNLILEKADVIARVERQRRIKKSKNTIEEEVVVDPFEDMLTKIMESNKQKWQ
jgi:hypothetical protein